MNELVGGFRNAIEKGASLEAVKKSFINAGYSPEEVEEAALEFSGAGREGRVSQAVDPAQEEIAQPQFQPQSQPQAPQQFYQPQAPQQFYQPQASLQPDKKRKIPKWLVVLLIVLACAGILVFIVREILKAVLL